MVEMLSVAKWSQAEVFYYTIVPILMIVGVLAALLFLMLLMYRENRRKIWLLPPLIVMLFCGAGFLIGDRYFHEFKTFNAVVTPNIRDREKQFSGYKYYDPDTLAAYKRIQSSEALEKLAIYQAEPVTREIEFLGLAHDSVYFKLGAQVYYVRMAPTFTDGDQAELQGVRYQLTDASYEALGFFPETNDYLQKIVIPEKLKGLVYEPQDSVRAQEFGRSQSQWALPSE